MKTNLKLLTADDLAERLSISTRTIWRYRRMGQIPKPVRIGRSVRWREEDIDAFVDNLAASSLAGGSEAVPNCPVPAESITAKDNSPSTERQAD